jgi:predicted transcriptional regulator
MVVYHSNGLHEGIADGAADEAEASTPKILAQRIRFGSEGRDLLEGVPAVYSWLSSDERPYIAVKRSKFLLNTEKCFRITDCRFNLQSVSNDAGIVHQLFNADRGIPIEIMAAARIGSVLIVDDGRLAGIFSERDVMLRVVLEHRDPRRTRVEEVMTSPVHAISMRMTGDEALKIMVQEHIRHLPIVDDRGQAQAIVSMRSLLQEKVSELHQQLDSLESYITADGIGG